MAANLFRRLWLRPCVAAVALLSGFGWLQAQAPTSAEVPRPTLRVTTHLVLLDAVVTDKQGKAITGLHPEDFTVQEKGKTQKIAFFTPPEALQNRPAPPDLAPGIYTNRPEFRTPGGPVTILLLDANNTPFRDQAYARLQMLQYVRRQMKPGERIGVYALANSLLVILDFTTDPQVLLTALQKYKPQDPVLGATLPPALSTSSGVDLRAGGGAAEMLATAQDQVRNFSALEVGYNMEIRTQTTLAAMRSLARILEGVPGRKTVVWLTAGFPFELIPEQSNISEAELLADLPSVKQKSVGAIASGAVAGTERTSHGEEIRQAAAQLAAAQIAIYPVDVRGLMSGMEFQAEDVANRQAVDSSGRAIARMSDADASQETMRDIATQTGGRAFVNENEIADAVGLAISDNAAAYTLGYYPEDKKWDGKYRTIKVKVNREGTQVRSRAGYYAIDPSQIKDRNPEREVAEGLADMAPDTQVTFSARVKSGEKGKVGVDFLVDPSTLSTEDASGGKKFNVAFYAAVFSPEGKMLANRSMKVDQAFNADTYQQILQHGMLLHMDVEAPSGNNRLHLAVRDNHTGNLGTLNASLSP